MGILVYQRSLWQGLTVPVPLPKLQQMKAVLHTLHFCLMHSSNKHTGVALSDQQVLVLTPQQILHRKILFQATAWVQDYVIQADFDALSFLSHALQQQTRQCSSL